MTRGTIILARAGHRVPHLQNLAKREGGSTDMIAGQGVALSPRNVYFTSLEGPAVAPGLSRRSPGHLAVASPDRQGEESRPGTIHPKKAAGAAGDNVLTIAVDLTDSIYLSLMAMGSRSARWW